MDRGRAFELLGYAAGTLAAFVVGLFGPAIAKSLAVYVPDDSVAKGVYGLVVLLLVGTVAGIFGRGIGGAAAMWFGLFLSDQAGAQLQPPAPNWLTPFVVGLAAATIGYGVARAVDPLWNGATVSRRAPRPVDTGTYGSG
ncbi:MAG TPA: hypothetical protein VK592_02085 [Candidatus Dormibacteraeota bacterium]|nr:hypothetical protein [Candidatus Dormibacteraeota bacterium]